MWWKRTPKARERVQQSNPTAYPSGLFVETPTGTFYIKKKTKYKLFSQRALESWSPPSVALATDEALQNFKYVGLLGFRDGTLIHNIADGRIYLVSETKRRHITSPDVFDYYGLDESRIIRVSDAEVKLHEEGAPIN